MLSVWNKTFSHLRSWPYTLMAKTKGTYSRKAISLIISDVCHANGYWKNVRKYWPITIMKIFKTSFKLFENKDLHNTYPREAGTLIHFPKMLHVSCCLIYFHYKSSIWHAAVKLNRTQVLFTAWCQKGICMTIVAKFETKQVTSASLLI